MYSPLPLFDDPAALLGGPLSAPIRRHGEPKPHERQIFRQKPLAFLVSDLFPAKTLRRRAHMREMPVNTMSRSKQTIFWGERFDQTDLDVLLVMLNRAVQARVSPGEPFRMHVADILTPLDRRANKQCRAWLKRCLFRLETGRIVIRSHRFSFATQLISKFLYDHQEHEVVAVLDHDLHRGFATERLPWLVRERMDLDDPLAKWLHGLAWAMAGPFRADNDCLFRLSGLDESERKEFPGRLAKAAEQLAHDGVLICQPLENGSWVITHSGSASANGLTGDHMTARSCRMLA